MFLFGHLGIGNALTKPWAKQLSLKWILLGTILPDLMDKPLFYSIAFISGGASAASELISGTRTFGHTAIALSAVTFLAFLRKSKLLAALALGITSHFILDGVSEELLSQHPSLFPQVLFWPLFGKQFPVYPYHGLLDHLSIWERPVLLYGELVGALLLGIEFLRRTGKKDKRKSDKS